MKDFLGTEIKAGNYLVTGGGGNAKAEYGMILYKVLETGKDSIKVCRLYADYREHIIKTKRSTVKKFTKYLVVSPSDEVISLFESGLTDPKTKDFDRIAKWIHGQEVF